MVSIQCICKCRLEYSYYYKIEYAFLIFGSLFFV